MVLYKRKPVQLLQPDKSISNNAEVWVMPKSGEVFTDYESYLKRYDFLSQKKFTDAVNGKSGMTFFAAVDTETSSSSGIDKIFPDALRDPILRKVQFSEIPRIDELVTHVFEEFRNDFFPGEEITVVLDEGEQLEGVIREKAKFPELRGPDGSLHRAAFSRYFVRLKDQTGEEALLDDKHIRRGRHVFTKLNLRSFLKSSLQRDSWAGAPWLVKDFIAQKHRLPMDIPAHLQQGARALEGRHSVQQQPRMQGHFNSVRGRKGKNLTPSDFSMDQMQQGVPDYARAQYDFTPVAHKAEPSKIQIPVKYPVEDLDLPLKRNGSTRPRMKFLAPLASDTSNTSHPDDLRMDSVGLLLEIWNTLNVQCEIYELDSFTFDDFYDAMKFSSDQMTCELLEEVHCAVLKQIVNADGQIQVALPDMIEEEESEEEDELMEESEVVTPLDAPAHATRSRLSQVWNAGNDREGSNAASESKHRSHRAADLLVEHNWVDRLKERDFGRGGWQIIMVGLLYQLSLDTRHKAKCEKILVQLAPLDDDPTQETIRQHYLGLGVNLRIAALEIITMLSLSTKAIRAYLESCSEDMTETRKTKLDHQKMRKEAMAELAKLETEKKILAPPLPASPKEDSITVEPANLDDTLETNGTTMSDVDDEEPNGARSLRRGTDRAADRKRKRDEESIRKEKERVDRSEAAKLSAKQLKDYKKVLKDIESHKDTVRECEDNIATCDRDLREANCQRTRVLGRDRFWNRYYWFERNGMPFAGLPNSSTAEYGYANARIWVQGPDEMERQGFIDLDKEEMDQYVAAHQLTVPERKKLEEGESNLQGATEWGYYDEPDSVDALLGWLDERGRREKELRKELSIWREDVVQQMMKLKQHREAEKIRMEENSEEQVTRVSTRHKTYVDVETVNRGCLRWRNLTAVDSLGHIHSEQPRAKEKRAKTEQKKEGKGIAQKVPMGKSGKPLTRQGTRSGKA